MVSDGHNFRLDEHCFLFDEVYLHSDEKTLLLVYVEMKAKTIDTVENSLFSNTIEIIHYYILT